MSQIPDHTYRDMKRVGRVFALLSLLLLALIVWVLAADHMRPWKANQATWREDVLPWMEAARRAQDDAADAEEAFANVGRSRAPLDWPLLDAFGRTVEIEQIEPPGLTVDQHFAEVQRVDRCTTCHAGSAARIAEKDREPLWRIDGMENDATLRAIAADIDHAKDRPAWTLRRTITVTLSPDGDGTSCGIELVDRSPLGKTLPTITTVTPDSPAARAGLEVGDVIVSIDGSTATSVAAFNETLQAASGANRSVELAVERGLPRPFDSHPRLDLFVGADSPHPMAMFGCTICHDGEGLATDFNRAAHEPNTASTLQAWREDHDWSPREHVEAPMRPARFVESGCLACHQDVETLAANDDFPDAAPKLVEGRRLVRDNGCFGCHEIQGADPAFSWPPTKVGPTLRSVGEKLDAAFLDAWLAEPTAYRPATRMPSFFGLHDHLDDATRERDEALEAAEIRAINAYLLDTSTPIPSRNTSTLPEEQETFVDRGVFAPDAVARGRDAFFELGCAACHRSPDFPAVETTLGPDLANLQAKLATPRSRRWLLDWIAAPSNYDPNTAMPAPLFDADADRHVLDLAAYGLSLGGPSFAMTESRDDDALDRLARSLLATTYTSDEIARILKSGVGTTPDVTAVGDAAELTAPITRGKLLRFVGRRSIAYRGCSACHDIEGFDDASPIGPALTGWGRKREELLAFEDVADLAARRVESDDDAFYLDLLRRKRREGFLWRKLLAPRSFDFQRAADKDHYERLTMGRFDFSPEQREAIMTFVLGLTDEPVASERSFHPTAAMHAVAAGRNVVAHYGCDQCHAMTPARMAFRYDPATVTRPVDAPDFAFLAPRFTPEERLASTAVDRAGEGLAVFLGRTTLDADGRPLTDEDADGRTILAFSPWRPALLDGDVWTVGVMDVPIPVDAITSRRLQGGGAFARLLYPWLVERTGDYRPELWGWTPPALIGEGRNVRAAWIEAYLRSPNRLRPAVVGRMPLYSLSDAELATLVDYFLAMDDGADAYGDRAPLNVTDVSPERLTRWKGAFALVTDRTTFCAKCHAIGAIEAEGSDTVNLGPNLASVGDRLRETHLRRWIANPRSVLPYTGMPVNFPPGGPPAGQDILPGTSLEQIDAVVDLLMHYDVFREATANER